MFEWKTAYASGLKNLDDQHEGLFNIAEQAYKLVLSHDEIPLDDIEVIIEDLLQYAVYHFSSEEEFWQVWDLQEYETQKRAHEGFADRLEGFTIRDPEINKMAYMHDLFDYLDRWFQEHVILEIPKIKAFAGQDN